LSFIIKIYDAILRSHLENVLWIGGGACSGKTNLTDLVAEQRRFVANHSEQFYQLHKDLACAENQAKTHKHVLNVVCKTSARKMKKVPSSGSKYLARDESSSIEDSLLLLEQHCGLL